MRCVMDPPTLMNQPPFPTAPNPAPYNNLSEIWHFPVNAAAESAPALALRVPHFLTHFGEAPSGDPLTGALQLQLHQRVAQTQTHAASKKRRDSAEPDSAKVSSASNGNDANANSAAANDSVGKRLKTAACRDENHESKAEAEPRSGKAEQNSQPAPEQPKQDYIHVRARRGQATDSHSLAERARREKISERMKILQDLVPGCNKVIGKALVLDEIINYIQSLQRQVEFLSMKLEAVNTRISPSMEMFPSKDYGQQTFDTTGVAFGSQATREYSRGSSPEWLHMQIGGGFERTT